jgi:murein DD-endopeptidase MepM/ murein hydrolase activator NlpD
MPTPPTPTRRAARRLAACAALALVTSLIASGAPVEAQSTRSQLDRASRSASLLKTKVGRIADKYASEERNLNRTVNRIGQTRTEIQRAEKEVAALKEDLRDRVRTAYRMGGLGFFEFILSARSFRDFSLRVMTLQRQSTSDEDLVLQLRKKQSELALRKRDLLTQKSAQSRNVAAYRNQARLLQISLGQAEQLRQDLQGRLKAEEISRLFRIGGGMSGGRGMVIPLDACPAAGGRSFTNSWGAPRSGGRRHKGTDVMAAYGSPAAAVVSGRISRWSSGGKAGTSIYLFGDDGNEYFYAHMSRNVASPGSRVQHGQIISYVGDTGNARGGAAHIHFEIHPGGGSAINPYPSLIRVC